MGTLLFSSAKPVITTAENQEKIVQEMALEGYLLLAGKSTDVTASAIADHLRCLLVNPYLIQALSRKAATVSDGQGAPKIAQCLNTWRNEFC